MRRDKLERLLNQFQNLRIAVCGDLFLDRWLTVDRGLDELSLETGLAAYQVVAQRAEPGVAGTILKNLAALGVRRLYAASLLGQDGDGDQLLRGLAALGVDAQGVVRSEELVTPAYLKPVFTGAGLSPQEGHRFDIRNRIPIPEALRARLEAGLRRLAGEVDAVIFSDQLTEEGAGVVDEGMRRLARQLRQAHPGLLVYADSRAFIHRFCGITIKCNSAEALAATGRPAGPFSLEQQVRCLQDLERQTGSRVFITCGSKGILARMEDDAPRLVEAVKQEGPIDVVGAGDACNGSLAGALCCGATAAQAAELANLVAGVTVRKLGTTGTATPAEVLALFDEQNFE